MAAPHAGFLRHANYRYLKLATLLCVGCIVAYLLDDPARGPGGGTWLGYTLGTIAALLIVWLAWLGIRKRRYRSTLGSVKGWTSAHVYLGLTLVTVTSLHAGFQFGWNIHTLAYLLMLGVILSGIYGIVAYTQLPTLITENLGSSDRDAMLNEILDLNHQSLKLGDQLGPEVHRVLVRSTERIRIGGSLREQLFGLRELRDDNDELRKLLGKQQQKAAADSSFEAASSATVMFMADQLVQAGRSGQTAERTRQLMDLISRRNALIQRVNRDIQLHARMRVWLHLHIPLTVALLVALVAHVLSVFLYW